jgi:methyl-accepting chemotaxis protein
MSELLTPAASKVSPPPSVNNDSSRPKGSKLRLGMLGRSVIAMLVVGLLPLALFGAVITKQQSDRIRSDAEASLHSNAERLAFQVDEWVDKNVRVLKAAASLPALTSMQRESQVEVLKAVHDAYPWMYLVFTISAEGRNVARSDANALTDYSDRQYYKDVATMGKDLSWETLIGKTSKKPALVVAVPIRSSGRVVGVLASAMTIEDISRTVATWKQGNTGYAFLVDEKAKVVAHPRDEFVLSQANLKDHPAITAYRSTGQSRVMSFTQPDGKRVLADAEGTKLGWAVAVQQEEEELFAPIRQTQLLGAVLLALAALLVAGIARAASTVLIRPILALTEAADRMSLGEVDEPIRSARNDELGRLARSLERLRKSLKAAFARIEGQ